MQATGSEILRLTCCLATEAGLRVCAPVHDALLLISKKGNIEHDVYKLQSYLQKASEVLLDGFPLRSENRIFTYPDRYRSEKGTEMWNIVIRHLESLVPSHPKLVA
jgi:DNA polymerase I